MAACYAYKGKLPEAIVISKEVPIENTYQCLLHEMVHAYVHLVLHDRSTLMHSPAFVRVLTRKYRKAGLSVDPEELAND